MLLFFFRSCILYQIPLDKINTNYLYFSCVCVFTRSSLRLVQLTSFGAIKLLRIQMNISNIFFVERYKTFCHSSEDLLNSDRAPCG